MYVENPFCDFVIVICVIGNKKPPPTPPKPPQAPPKGGDVFPQNIQVQKSKFKTIITFDCWSNNDSNKAR